VNYKHMLNSRSIYEQIGVSNTFLRHTQKKLFTFKNSPVFFWPTLYFFIFIILLLYIIYFIIFYSLLFFLILLGMDSKCFLTSTDLQTRRARCQHQLSFL